MVKKIIVLLALVLLAISCGCANRGNGEFFNSGMLSTTPTVTSTTETPEASLSGTLPAPTVVNTKDILSISLEEQVFSGGETIGDVINYFGEMTKEEILQKYGEGYEMVENEETWTTTYQYTENGLIFVFENELNELIQIIPDFDMEVFVLRGFKKGMTMDDVVRLFGESISGIKTDKFYDFENCVLCFSAEEDGTVSLVDFKG